jgi:O-antigen/teichoic acid export membrane protein
MANAEAILVKQTLSKSIVQRVTANFGWSLVSEGIGRGSFFLANIYLARVLGVSSFGLFILAQSLTFSFWVAVDLGTNMYGIREIARRKDDSADLINTLLTLRLVAGLAVFCFYSLSIWFVNISPSHRYVFWACGLYLLTYSLYTDWVAKGLEHFKYLTYGSLVSSLTFVFGILVLVRTEADVVVAATLWSVSFLFASLTLGYFLKNKIGLRYRLILDLRQWQYHLRESIFYTISGSLFVLYQYLPIFFLSLYFSTYEVGVFAASSRVIMTICSAGFLLPMAFYPILADLYVNDKKNFYSLQRKFQKVMAVIGMPPAILGTIFAHDIIMLLFGEQYLQSVGLFRIMVWMIPIFFIRFTYGSVLLATGFQRHQIIAAMIGLIIILVLAFILIPTKGPIGAALAALFTELFLIAVFIIISRFTFMRK